MANDATCIRCGRGMPSHSSGGRHNACYFTIAAQDDLLLLKQRFAPHLTNERMARDLGVSEQILTVSLFAAGRRAWLRRRAGK